jgi:hypothetical protein
LGVDEKQVGQDHLTHEGGPLPGLVV